ncbi:MarR family transcriptional regulator [Acetobacter orientalis]|uniref:MarR family transcriptional regulator n=1 Tax=Acetobacter orientalis TaxID=146474 RepID=A0A252C0Z3_9PROT|nr:MarR family transcriptional regulator [Acetobacter orientalis]MDN6041851.1 MarR family transcriptional regulator [Acetobacter sp.]MCP1216312.1 MarR family transcriptional regulator [Acetobacter orientalis]MCP1219201.1 MarR family transcriptional regulator [Acetobacter orientalis]MCP1220600.1 MarR family transcriptional regulator [Acetobacter orientalis]OUI98940.1 MarR family transcriptional regulator [Acetobacter orientalis]
MQRSFEGLDESRFHDMALTFRIMRLAAIWRTRLERALRPHGMTVALMRPMAYLMMMPDGATQRDLAIAMDTDCSALVRVLDLLEKEGFVARQPDVQDRRAKHIMLTPSGQQRCALFHQVAAQVEQDMTQTLPLPDRKPLIALLDTVLAAPPELSA